jgi:hypothetical protein
VVQTEVTGKVSYNGATLARPNGKIVFVGPDGNQAEAKIAEDGTYKASKVTAGLNKVVVYYPNPDFKPVSRPKGPPSEKDRPVVIAMYLTPEKYSNVDTSELSVQVGKGTVYNVELTGPEIR